MEISIIIVTYNSLNYIKECISSILNNIGQLRYEIIVVDNSEDAIAYRTKDYLESMYGQSVIYIKNDENLGYGQGNNVGFARSKGDLICIMNPDVVITNKLLFANALSQFENNKKLGMLGYKQIGASDLSFYTRQEFYFPFLSSFVIKLSNKCNYFNSGFMHLSGAFFFTSRSAFIEIGQFDEKIFLYNEEADITQRFLKNNYFLKYEKNINYIHNIGDRNEISFESFVYEMRSALYYLNKYSFRTIPFLKKMKFELKIRYYFQKLLKNSTSDSYSKKINYIDELLMLNY